MEILQEHGLLEEVIEFCFYCLRCMGGGCKAGPELLGGLQP